MSTDPIWLETESVAMATAIRNARASFWEFAREVELENWRTIPAHDAALIKAYFPETGPKKVWEFLFVDEVVITRSAIKGTLVSQPKYVRGLAPEQAVTVLIENVCDWFLVIGGKGLGGFTVDVLKKTIPPDRLEEYESQPPVSWYRHRKSTTAQSELDQVPVCKKCNKRDLTDMSYREGLCGCCANGLSRTTCPTCGVPLIRSNAAPQECFSCVTAKGRQS